MKEGPLSLVFVGPRKWAGLITGSVGIPLSDEAGSVSTRPFVFTWFCSSTPPLVALSSVNSCKALVAAELEVQGTMCYLFMYDFYSSVCEFLSSSSSSPHSVEHGEVGRIFWEDRETRVCDSSFREEGVKDGPLSMF